MAYKPQISVVIQTYNEETNIKECIESARRLTDSIIVVDTQSTDRTVEIAKQENVPVYSHPFVEYVEPVRNFAIKKATTPWVFLLDADERFTPELINEINRRIDKEPFTYYKVSRKEYFGKKTWLKYGGWWPNYIIRLINTKSFINWPSAIHSTPEINGTCGMLEHSILHFSKNDYEVIVNKTINFEDKESELLYKADRPVSTNTFFRKFFGELYRRLIKKQGFRDGTIGLIESLYQAFSKTITYLYLYEKKTRRSL